MITVNPNKENYNNDIPSGKNGYYQVVYTENDLPKPLRRLFQDDNEGVLYIGITSRLQERIAEIVKSLPFEKRPGVLYKGDSHQLGKKAKKINTFFERFYITGIRIQYEVLSDDINIKDYERNKINKYIESHGEAPPFNSI
ncbi:MAG: hypothetical protein A2475_01185 [Ignavibacteria bacterium RIFOXYC2_FULL_35_21]|nr:MAG: hypothetical protein A2220_01860 [Ignavibacteria bacterium RIFOXYA2_FULL_35_10]OGV21259.1 MAG: hypothetical protein A2475_01185 [Ignavibacteria bacterium RIFOXYC2_FULL_35_21]